MFFHRNQLYLEHAGKVSIQIEVEVKRLKLKEMVAQRSRYYTPNEVALHNTPSDLWVSFLGKVYDLTELVKTNFENDLIAPI